MYMQKSVGSMLSREFNPLYLLHAIQSENESKCVTGLIESMFPGQDFPSLTSHWSDEEPLMCDNLVRNTNDNIRTNSCY